MGLRLRGCVEYQYCSIIDLQAEIKRILGTWSPGNSETLLQGVSSAQHLRTKAAPPKFKIHEEVFSGMVILAEDF